jgi:hypothetical protein
MPRKTDSAQLVIHLASESERELVHKQAKKRGYKITADYLRDLISRDMTEAGDPHKFDVDRGGNRREPQSA